MNSKKNVALLIIATLAIFITLVITFSTLFKVNMQKMQEVANLTKEALTSNSSTNNETIETKGAHGTVSGTLWVEALPSNINKVFIPTVNGAQLYCIEKGVSLKSGLARVAEIKALNGTKGVITSTYHPGALPAKRYSNTYYVCVNNHTEMVPSGAYIITAPSNFIAPYDGTYSYGSTSTFKKGENISQEVRQVAIWLNEEMNKGENFYESGASFSYIDMAEQLKNEAMAYRDYATKLKEKENEPLKNTTSEEIKVTVDSEEETLILGPYKIEYAEGNSGTAKFAGISNITVKGYNDKEKKVFIKDLEIISYIQNGKENKLDFFTPLKEEGYVDRTENSYPASSQEFYIKIKNPNSGVSNTSEKVRYVDIDVEYSYMEVKATQCTLEGHQLVATPIPVKHYDGYNSKTNKINTCTIEFIWNVTENPLKQQEVIDAWGERILHKVNIHLPGKPGDDDTPLDITMKLGGYTWEDVLEGKENLSNGMKTEADVVLPNVKVTLYECTMDENKNVQYKDGRPVANIAVLLSETDKQELSKEELLHRVNSQLTDENGYYQFDGLDVFKKYFVTFEYNGQIYMPTDYLKTESNIKQTSVQSMVNAKLYNTDIWAITSKASEASNVREGYNNKFAEIGSSPKGYKSSNSLNSGKLVEGYNETFSINDLMGYKLQENGTYKAVGEQLIDSIYTIDSNGNIVKGNSISEGLISKKIKEYIQKEYKYPDSEALLTIYQSIASQSQDQENIWKKLQYIEDCKIEAYTASPSGNIDLYPVYDKFVVDTESKEIPGVGTVPPIYNGQFYVNLGLWRRTVNNLALRKDIYRTATRINGKTEVYKYNKRENTGDYWEISLRMQDYNNYYGSNYNREIYKSDYEYKSANTNLYGKELELYVTYQIVIRNLSEGILNEVTEVVDYYDKDYTYVPELSWVMYSENGINEELAVPAKSYYNMINNLDLNQISYAKNINSTYGKEQNSSGNYCGTSIYGTASTSNLETKYNSVYINGLDSKKLQTGEDAYIYLTFKVNKDNKGPVILDDDNSLKQNYVEINGYKSYYKEGTKLPNDITISGNNTVAGLIDENSTPGNLQLKDLEGEKYEKNFEDDTDRAKGIKVILDEKATRELNGVVWEDERTQNVNNAIIGDGVRQAEEIGIKGITVELVEKMENGSEYVWQTAETNENGSYKFTGFIPGNYIVRFKYGNDVKNVLTQANGGQNAVSYNGQDFKSTVYSKDLKNNITLSKYEDAYYNIAEADKLSANQNKNVSDAKDLWESKTVNIGRTQNNQTNYQNESYQGRTNVNNYSVGEINNIKAQILASPYAESINNSAVQELIANTNMVAETPIIVAEIEYNRTISAGSNTESNGNNYLYNNEKNGNYTLNSIDFGLTERPKAQLELNKKVTNVKLTLSDGTVVFDANKTVNNLSWLEGSPYNLSSLMKNNKYQEYYNESKTNRVYNRYSYKSEIANKLASLYQNGRNGLIQAIIDDEIVHGATLQVSYELTVKNASETDYLGKDFYYSGTGASESNKVTTSAGMVIDYVSNNLQYTAANNSGWTLAKGPNTTIVEGLVDNNVKEKTNLYNNILATTELSKNLKPGENTTKDLKLSQIIYSGSESDNKVYENIAEIVKTSNTAGRRMAYSIVGNQDPTNVPSEVDSSKAETIVVTPPFGYTQIIVYSIVALLAAAILTVGIIFIKKKVIQ